MMEEKNNSYNEEFDKNNESDKVEEEYVYKTVMRSKENSRSFSLVSLVLSVLSLLFSPISYVGLILGGLAIGFACYSRKNLGYFDGYSLAGLIIGIFGVVFSFLSLIFTYLIADTEFYKQLTLEWEKIFQWQINGLKSFDTNRL